MGIFRLSRKDMGDKAKTTESSCDRKNLDQESSSVVLSKLFLRQSFACGAYSQIYHGIYDDEAVAVKMVKEDDQEVEGGARGIGGVLADRLEKLYTSEVHLLSRDRLHHPNVVKFMGAYRQYPVYCVITEYADQGSLRGYLHKLENPKSLPLKKLVAMALDMARGMEYIHSEGVIHRDLKPENVLIDKEFRLKIADFGIVCEEADCDPLAKEPAGTYCWMAPEVIKRKPFGRKVDVYSFRTHFVGAGSRNVPFQRADSDASCGWGCT